MRPIGMLLAVFGAALLFSSAGPALACGTFLGEYVIPDGGPEAIDRSPATQPDQAGTGPNRSSAAAAEEAVEPEDGPAVLPDDDPAEDLPAPDIQPDADRYPVRV